MIEFQWPWMFILLVLPFVMLRLLPKAQPQQEAALRVPDLSSFNTLASGPHSKNPSSHAMFWLAFLAWACLVSASARPVWFGEPVELPVSGRDLMLAVDLSGSMQVEDFVINGKTINRLLATQIVAGEFIERRVGDRIGLILFGRNAYVQTPLTFDRKTVRSLLEEAVIGLAGKETAIGDAIGLAVKRLRADKAANKTLILLTDGANTAGEVEPVKAAELAAEVGLTIYTIGIGADEMIVQSFFGNRRVNPSQDLDEKTLSTIAEKTGGKYFRARDTDELNKIYSLLDELEPIALEQKTFRPQRSLFYWPLAVALGLSFIILILRLHLFARMLTALSRINPVHRSQGRS
ncbi:MAG: VWA domain-containing protein [Gammaproteobacteria bacterium]|nr:VWA domain-containing protein [Gammaproteobacteria bacterium]